MRIHVTAILALLAATALLTLAACAQEATPTTEPEPTATTEPEPTATTEPEPEPAAAGGPFPVTVTDMLDREIEIAEQPASVVSISPASTEMLYRIGATAVGRDDTSKYPPEAQDLPTVGGAYTPSVEGILGLEPDLILIEALSQAHLLGALEKIGAPVLAVRAASLEDVVKSLSILGEVTGRQEEADRAAADITDRVGVASASGVEPRRVVILISDADRNIYAAKPGSYPGAVAGLLNMTNLAEDMPDAGPFPDFALFSGEDAVTSDPDIIFAISPAPEPAPRLSRPSSPWCPATAT